MVRRSAATSPELQEALTEDRVDGRAVNESRRIQCWGAQIIVVQWQFLQARRGLLPSFNEAGSGAMIGGNFRVFRSYRAWWEGITSGFAPEFVAWVEEQRAKAA